MPKEKTVALAAPTDENDEIELTLAEFCQRLSVNERRVELLGAFHSVEVKAGRTKDVTSAFAARFEAFANQPV